MAGGGVGEAMLIGAAVGAGTGGIMSAAQDKDVGQGMLLGALGGAATGGIGSGIGGAAGSAAENIAANAAANTATDVAANTAASAATDTLASTAANTAAENTVNTLAQQGANQAATSMASTPALSSTVPNLGANPAASTAMAEGASQGAQTWGQQGIGQGVFPAMTNAQVAGASTAGGISGLVAANGQPAPYENPNTQPYNGPLSKFKLAGPSLSQYSYNPATYQPSVAPGYAEGGITSLQTGLYPQSQMNRMQFSTPSQMPVSREIIGSDYDNTISPYTGDLPRFGEGGGINFIHNLQPGGEFGDITADMYGAVQEHKPQWLQDMEPGGFIGATVPGKLDWEEKKRKEEEEKIAQDRAAKEARAAQMYNDMAQQSRMAHGGIADLGSYSDGGRLLRGPGDGMSDNIPASIGGKQPARLADGEFVVPADVVSHLGNGSTDAGAKTLYKMMDKVRQARTGSKKQGREINADKYMPKMAQGGIAHFASGNLVVNGENNEVGYWSDGTWTPVTSQQYTNAASVQGAPSGYTPSIYDPTPYSPQPYEKQFSALSKQIEDQQRTLKSLEAAPLFDAKYYLAQNPDVAAAGVDPYQHYLDWGKSEARKPYEGAQGFDAAYYLAQNPDVAASQWASNPIYHYGMWGKNEGRSPYEGAKAGVSGVGVQDQAAIAAAQKAIADMQAQANTAQQKATALQESPIHYTDYTLSNRPSANAPQYYGNIYQIPSGYGQYIREGYNQNAGLGSWNNEYGGSTMPTSKQANIANSAVAQRDAANASFQQAQQAAQQAIQSMSQAKQEAPKEEKKRSGGIATLVKRRA